MSTTQSIRQKLESALAPCTLDIQDESAAHRGHAGYREGKQTHFKIKIISARFAGLSRIEQHRLVYSLLAKDMENEVHALALQTAAPSNLTETKEKEEKTTP